MTGAVRPVRPYVPGMAIGIGYEVGTLRWYQERIDAWSQEVREQIHFGRADLAASYAETCFLYARLSGHWAAQEPQEIQ